MIHQWQWRPCINLHRRCQWEAFDERRLDAGDARLFFGGHGRRLNNSLHRGAVGCVHRQVCTIGNRCNRVHTSCIWVRQVNRKVSRRDRPTRGDGVFAIEAAGIVKPVPARRIAQCRCGCNWNKYWKSIRSNCDKWRQQSDHMCCI